MTRTIAAATAVAILGVLSAGAALAQRDDVAETAPAGTALVVVEDAWSRPSPTAEGVGVAYMRLVNPGAADDVLIGASTPAAAVVELHETAVNADGMMSMSPVTSIVVPAGGESALAPGGYHLMLIDLVEPLEEGEAVELTLEFEISGPVAVTVDVVAMDATGPMDGMEMGSSDDMEASDDMDDMSTDGSEA